MAPARSPWPNFYCRALAVTSMWRRLIRLHPGSRRVSSASGEFCSGRRNPEPGEGLRAADLAGPTTPLHTRLAARRSQERPATQVSSCCNKLLLTQDYGSLQIPPREQGNKHSLPGLCPVVPPVGNPRLYLLLLQASSGRSARPFRPTLLSGVS